MWGGYPAFALVNLLLLIAVALSNGRSVLAQVVQPFMIETIAWNNAGTEIAVGGTNISCEFPSTRSALYVLDAGAEYERDIQPHTCSILDVEWSPDNSKIAASGQDGVGYISDSSTGQLLIQTKETAPGFRREGITWNSDGTLIADFVRDVNRVFVWDPLTGETLVTFRNSSDVTALAWEPNGHRLAVGSLADKVHIIDGLSGSILSTMNVDNVYSLAWSPHGDKLAVGGFRTVIFDISTNQVIREISEPEGDAAITELDWNPDNIRLVTIVGGYNTVRVWDTSIGIEVDSFISTSPIFAIDWNPNETLLAYNTDNTTVVV